MATIVPHFSTSGAGAIIIVNMKNFIKNLKENIDAFEGVDLKPETNLTSLPEWDSIALLSTMAMISSVYKVALKGTEINSTKNVAELYELVQSKAY